MEKMEKSFKNGTNVNNSRHLKVNTWKRIII